jgi:hypothetical protein
LSGTVVEDGWSRPDRDVVRADVVEVPLDGDHPHHDDDAPSRTRRRQGRLIAGLSILGATAAVAVAVVATGGNGEVPPSVDPDDLATIITTPPTLPPDERAAVPNDSAEPPFSEVIAGVATLPLLDAAPASAAPPEPASVVPTADRPLRSVTEHQVGSGGFSQTITITNDPDARRYLLEIEFGDGPPRRIVVDLAGGHTYLPLGEPTDGWQRLANDEVGGSAGAGSAAALLRALQLGPLRTDTLDGIRMVTHNGTVDVPDLGGRFEELVVAIEAGSAPLWSRYALGPLATTTPPSADELVGYAVYVDPDGRLARVTGGGAFGVTTERFVHTIEWLDAPPPIEIPERVRAGPGEPDPNTAP